MTERRARKRLEKLISRAKKLAITDELSLARMRQAMRGATGEQLRAMACQLEDLLRQGEKFHVREP
jgi:hypothetical protein